MSVDEDAPPIIGATANEPLITPSTIQQLLCPPGGDSPPSFTFFGGIQLTPPANPSIPSDLCAFSTNLLGQVQPLLAALQPIFNVTDVLATLIQCFLLAVEAITNPFKIKQLLACLPGLAEKLNQLLSLIPTLPQGLVIFIQMVVDVIRLVMEAIDCVLRTVASIRAELEELEIIAQAINSTEDESVAAQLQTTLECGQQAAASNTAAMLAALQPIARILCTTRAILLLIPGGGKIASLLVFPDPTNLSDTLFLDEIEEVLSVTRQVLQSTIELLAALALGQVSIEPPEINFACPLDALQDEGMTPLPEPEEPTITALRNPTTDAVLSPPEVAVAASPSAADAPLRLVGTHFDENSLVYWGTAQIPTDKVTYLSAGILDVQVPAELRTVPGEFFLSVVNVASEGNELFSGVDPDATPRSKASEPYQLEVG